jgi:hypothetical protein
MKCLRSLENWDRGFESHTRHRCFRLFCVCVLLCRQRQTDRQTDMYTSVAPGTAVWRKVPSLHEPKNKFRWLSSQMCSTQSVFCTQSGSVRSLLGSSLSRCTGHRKVSRCLPLSYRRNVENYRPHPNTCNPKLGNTLHCSQQVVFGSNTCNVRANRARGTGQAATATYLPRSCNAHDKHVPCATSPSPSSAYQLPPVILLSRILIFLVSKWSNGRGERVRSSSICALLGIFLSSSSEIPRSTPRRVHPKSFQFQILVRRWGLAPTIGPNWVRFTWTWRQNPASETLCLKKINRTVF